MITPPKLSLYIHFPWCVQKCPYCDFNSHQLKTDLDEATYVDALLTDLEQDLPLIWGRTINTIFMGGGTPSLFSAQSMQRLLSGIRALLPIRPDAEITMEVNPGSQEFDDLSAYRQAGINRLSFGVQSLDNNQLRVLGRIHNADQAIKAIDKAQQAGFDNFNTDLMFALPNQSLSDARNDLQALLDLSPPHVSYYQLTLEPNTLFAVKPPTGIPDEGLQQDMYFQGQDILAEAGYQQYEVSAYAGNDNPAEHNLNYWRFGDYLGIGAGAHSKITQGHNGEIIRLVKQKHPQMYLNKVHQPERIIEQKTLNKNDLLFEFLLNHLRLKEPIPLKRFHERTGLDVTSLTTLFKESVPENWYRLNDQSITLTETGFLNSDVILQQLL
ncbi:YggW family oxidoreductase [Marinicella pacifica]|uniref:Heme chaperone HemW n=1 Tax=Marinicella pacifica TaxID=1171543 RepID=A0A917FMX3_9GAMM|nr:radical SAM family heme chaperone HemW [Marinicella pacifica]GGF93382.1 YggW family oxidoreductase [Marinicella pacifica]